VTDNETGNIEAENVGIIQANVFCNDLTLLQGFIIGDDGTCTSNGKKHHVYRNK
jgi:hypothetical protein